MAKGKNSHTRAPVRRNMKFRARTFGPRSLVSAPHLKGHLQAPDLRNPKWRRSGDVCASGPRSLLLNAYLNSGKEKDEG